ncbi:MULTISPECIES: ABC transporter permease [Corynebacterium]|uniref:ABC transporter permease n=2 Tax=Corynebacterium urealyticum TaxID=43771 RepID=A0A5D4FLB9_9CORY|nr:MULTISPECIES: ABC transporter permease [Corynebacterium]MDK6302699.1 ABC transporter permease [Corynebacterium sp. UMB9976]MDK7135696.1 ABC transporter permease [Corynebacterium sp. UMB4614]MDK8790451.1 ABC transporter permease [Corynebacterium sp. MSK039]OFO15904.1 sugar ABC transporter permease [Corynebacterium sp. HMSC22B11]QQC42556.1 ABC transporter permease [Corynebacterium urealyticum]
MTDLSRITATHDGDIPASRSQTFAAAWDDLTRGFQQRELWLALGWQDIKQRYRRSVLGPLWITIATGVMAAALGLLYSQLFGIDVAVFLPHVAVGLIMWGFIAGCIKEGAEVFISNEGLIKQLPSALSVHVYRLVWRQFLFLLHNLVIWLALLAIFRIPVGWEVLLAVPGLALLIINGVWVTMFFGIVATRFRDVAPLLDSLVQLAFYMTPIVWTAQTLTDQGGAVAERAALAKLNPLYHYLEIVRGPMINVPVEASSWYIVIAMTVVGLGLALLAMRKWRFRVSYWV